MNLNIDGERDGQRGDNDRKKKGRHASAGGTDGPNEEQTRQSDCRDEGVGGGNRKERTKTDRGRVKDGRTAFTVN